LNVHSLDGATIANGRDVNLTFLPLRLTLQSATLAGTAA
jgi:hypothetical protein